MITIRKSEDRGGADHGWLKAKHSFSFAGYYDPAHMGFRSLRVINEDVIAGGGGFPPHPHENMEIITYIISGELEHKDSTGTGSVIKAGEVQYMSAGTGVVHSEFNHSASTPLHLLQIWLLPNEFGAPPRYDQQVIDPATITNRLGLIASGSEGGIHIHQDMRLYACKLTKGGAVEHRLEEGRALWLQLISGEVTVNDESIRAGDAVRIEREDRVDITAKSDAHFLLFDLE
jgi:redox-sensitive bicupin YhaK (pirin superfamily)